MPRGTDGLLWKDVQKEVIRTQDRALGTHGDFQWWVAGGRLEGDQVRVAGSGSLSESQCHEVEASG